MKLQFEMKLQHLILGALALFFILFCLYQFASIRAELRIAEVIRVVKVHDQILGQIVQQGKQAPVRPAEEPKTQ